jgi:hypothetical protein
MVGRESADAERERDGSTEAREGRNMAAASFGESTGLGLVYQVADSRVWWAPETMRAYALVLIGTLLALALLKWATRGEPPLEVDPGDFLAQQSRAASACRGMRWSAAFLGYALVLTVACGIGMCLVGRLDIAGKTILTVPVTAGFPAAVAGLFWPAVLLSAVCLAIIVIAWQRGAAVVGTGLLALIWLWVTAPVLVVMGIGLARQGSSAGEAMAAVGAFAAGAGAWLWRGSLAGGHMLAARLRLREQQAQWEHAQYEAQHAPETGEYVASGGVGYWNSSWLPVKQPVVSLAREIRWDREGITVHWSPGGAEQMEWDELLSLRHFEGVASKDYARGEVAGVEVGTSSGPIRITSDGDGYRELTAALEAHIWGRQRPDTRYRVLESG